jgi:hypothetical protein
MTFPVPTGEFCHCEPLPSFPGRMLRLAAAAAAGALVVISSSPAALMLTVITVLVAVSALSLVILTAVLGRGAPHQEALKMLRVVLGDHWHAAAGQDADPAPYPGSSRRAVHRSIVVVDVEGFGDERRASWHQVAVRDGLYQAMESAFGQAGIPWAGCDHEDRGDGIFILVPPEMPKELLAESLPPALAAELDRHNRTHDAPERIRLRMALHAGEVRYDRHGTTAAAVNLAFRLLEADALKASLAAAPGVLAVITSAWFFHEVIRHNPACDPAAYSRVQVTVKETTTTGWIHLPDHNHPAGRPPADARPVCRQLTEATHPDVGEVAGQGLSRSRMRAIPLAPRCPCPSGMILPLVVCRHRLEGTGVGPDSGVDLRAHAEVQAERLQGGERHARRADLSSG